MSKLTTYVLELPNNPDKRKAIIDGVNSLVSQNGGMITAQSVNDEISYTELLTTELESHIGFAGVEEIRHAFEKAGRS